MRSPMPRQSQNSSAPSRHLFYEDALALVIGSMLVSTGIGLYGYVGLLTGGTAGITFLIHYLTGAPFGPVFFLVNLPFCVFAFRNMDRRFRRKSLVASSLVSIFTIVQPQLVHYSKVNLPYSAALGGVMMGTGFVVLFRHQACLGGVNFVALFFQEAYGFRAGKIQMVVDVMILMASCFIVKPLILAGSVMGAIVLNLVIALNHRPGRYTGA
ncbi:YitT family protein [Paraburkholderia pallida]